MTTLVEVSLSDGLGNDDVDGFGHSERGAGVPDSEDGICALTGTTLARDSCGSPLPAWASSTSR